MAGPAVCAGAFYPGDDAVVVTVCAGRDPLALHGCPGRRFLLFRMAFWRACIERVVRPRRGPGMADVARLIVRGPMASGSSVRTEPVDDGSLGERLPVVIYTRLAQQTHARRSGALHGIVLAAAVFVADAFSSVEDRLFPRPVRRTDFHLPGDRADIRLRDAFDRLHYAIDFCGSRTVAQCAQVAGYDCCRHPGALYGRAPVKPSKPVVYRTKGDRCDMAVMVIGGDGAVVERSVSRRFCRRAISEVGRARFESRRTADGDNRFDGAVFPDRAQPALRAHRRASLGICGGGRR